MDVKSVGDLLFVSGMFPSYKADGQPSDIVRQYEVARKNRSLGKQRTGKDSPHIRFANADTDDQLIAFVRVFGPVTAESVRLLGDPQLVLTATQDIEELRNEQATYRATLALIMQLNEARYNFDSAQTLIASIASNIGRWPHQWERERAQRKVEPFWKSGQAARQRIKDLSSGRPDALLGPKIAGRIVVCELLNIFPALVFPNLMEMHGSIRFGIRPLLYSILRREFLYPHETGVCANTRCRKFFEIERAGQRFCDDSCSLQQRQRDYWKSRGKKLRTKRLKQQKKARNLAT